MEQISDHMEMLHAVDRPAFCVKGGIIVKVNADAAGLLIETGIPVADLLETGSEEYAAFTGGCLYLNLSLAGHSMGWSVLRMEGFDLFRLEDDEDDRELKAMALAARTLRDPLSSVMITADRLFPLSGLADDPQTREQVARLNRGLMQMLRVINNMSDAERYHADTGVRQQIRDISAVIGEVFEKAASLVEHTGIALRYEGLHETVYSLTDSDKLERAILNLLSNALKFTPRGGSICAKLTRRGKKLYLTIQDSGRGIDESLRGQLFSRYVRQPGLEDGSFGIGLGMVLVRAAAALHGGTVLVDQPASAGIRVTMSLAIRQESPGLIRNHILIPDYAGELDHALVELSEVLPHELYGNN